MPVCGLAAYLEDKDMARPMPPRRLLCSLGYSSVELDT